MGGCASYIRSGDFNASVASFEKSFPFSHMNIQEFEERVKRLVSEEDNNEITMAQIVESFRDHALFGRELTQETSELKRILTSRFFKKP